MSEVANNADVRLGDLVGQLGGELIGDPQTRIERIQPLESAEPGAISFLSNPRYAAALSTSRAACVIVAPASRDAAAARGAAIVVDQPYLYFARLTRWWAARHRTPAPAGVHPSAVVDPSASVGARASIGPFCVIGARALIGDDAVIGPHAAIGDDVLIGASTVLHARVTIEHGCSIGARGIVHSGVVIGADGFGFAPHEGRWEKIEQLGAVRIGEDVEIGANTCIDRGALGDTVIEDGVKLDNLIQVGHNVHIGRHSAMAGCVGIAGSAKIGAHCTVGGAAGIAGHLEIADHVHIGPMSMVSRSIHRAGHYAGAFPIDDNAAWIKNAAALRQLSPLRDRVKALERAVADRRGVDDDDKKNDTEQT